MKQQNQDFIILFLIFILVVSIIINCVQGNRINSLMNEVADMEYIQSALSDHIDELEANDSITNDIY